MMTAVFAALSPHRRALFGGFLAFVLIGAEQALYGPSFESLAARFGISAAEVSLTVSLHFLGSFATMLVSGLLLAALGYRRVLAGSALLLASGTGLVAAAPAWPVVLAGSLAAGMGFGSLNVVVNLLVIRTSTGRVAPSLNLLNASYGLGAVLGPALVALTVPRVEVAFLVVALSVLLLVLMAAGLSEPAPLQHDAGSSASIARAAGFVTLLFIYVSSEIAVASWEATHLTPFVGAARAAAFTSLYWGAIMVGRLLVTPLGARTTPGRLVMLSAAVALAGALLTGIPAAAPYGYVVVGLGFAPIFPGTLAWLAEAFPNRAERLAPVAIACANLGPVATAPLIGVAVGAAGITAVPLALSAMVSALLAVAMLLSRPARNS